MQFGAYCRCSLYVGRGTWLLHSQISDYYDLFFLSFFFFYSVDVLFFGVFSLIHSGIRISARARGEPCLNCPCSRLISAPTISCAPPPALTTTTTSSPPPSTGSLSCATNNSLFCAVPCERRHSLSQGHGARGDCWAWAS